MLLFLSDSFAVWNIFVTFVVLKQKTIFDIMKYSQFYRLIESAGWVEKKGRRHKKYVHPDYDYFIPVARHPSKEIPTGTLGKMMRQAGLEE